MIINICASYNGLIMSLQVILVLVPARRENTETGLVKAATAVHESGLWSGVLPCHGPDCVTRRRMAGAVSGNSEKLTAQQ
ncbi:MAG: hypothetical protein ABJ388_10235 [Alphaproteobacteria bacterium]|jgi:hypothetical protein